MVVVSFDVVSFVVVSFVVVRAVVVVAVVEFFDEPAVALLGCFVRWGPVGWGLVGLGLVGLGLVGLGLVGLTVAVVGGSAGVSTGTRAVFAWPNSSDRSGTWVVAGLWSPGATGGGDAELPSDGWESPDGGASAVPVSCDGDRSSGIVVVSTDGVVGSSVGAVKTMMSSA